jgi:hypothetical protein
LLDTPTSSLAAFTSEAQALRFRLGKTYTQLNFTFRKHSIVNRPDKKSGK